MSAESAPTPSPDGPENGPDKPPQEGGESGGGVPGGDALLPGEKPQSDGRRLGFEEAATEAAVIQNVFDSEGDQPASEYDGFSRETTKIKDTLGKLDDESLVAAYESSVALHLDMQEWDPEGEINPDDVGASFDMLRHSFENADVAGLNKARAGMRIIDDETWHTVLHNLDERVLPRLAAEEAEKTAEGTPEGAAPEGEPPEGQPDESGGPEHSLLVPAAEQAIRNQQLTDELLAPPDNTPESERLKEVESTVRHIDGAISALPYLDPERAEKVYGRIIEDEQGQYEDLIVGMATKLPGLTNMIGDRAIPLWEQILHGKDAATGMIGSMALDHTIESGIDMIEAAGKEEEAGGKPVSMPRDYKITEELLKDLIVLRQINNRGSGH